MPERGEKAPFHWYVDTEYLTIQRMYDSVWEGPETVAFQVRERSGKTVTDSPGIVRYVIGQEACFERLEDAGKRLEALGEGG